jgi:hypothetical protein
MKYHEHKSKSYLNMIFFDALLPMSNILIFDEAEQYIVKAKQNPKMLIVFLCFL